MHPPEHTSLAHNEFSSSDLSDTCSTSTTPSRSSYHTPPTMQIITTAAPSSAIPDKQDDINLPLTREQLHGLNNEQLVMTIMASSVLLQARLNMKPIDEVDQVLAQYEVLVKQEGKEQASMIGLAPDMAKLIEKIELVAEKEKVEDDFDYVLDCSNGAIYKRSEEKNELVEKSTQKKARSFSRESGNSSRSDDSNGSEAETYLSQFYSAQISGTHSKLLDQKPSYEKLSPPKAKTLHQNPLQKVLINVLDRKGETSKLDEASTEKDHSSNADPNFVTDLD